MYIKSKQSNFFAQKCIVFFCVLQFLWEMLTSVDILCFLFALSSKLLMETLLLLRCLKITIKPH